MGKAKILGLIVDRREVGSTCFVARDESFMDRT
jgi:hypothetical protein